MRGIVAVETCHTGEQILIAFARQQIPVIERGPAEIGQQRIARAIDADLMPAPHLDGIVEQGGLPKVTNRHSVHPALPSVSVKRIQHIGSAA
jgi:hypothetical protein